METKKSFRLKVDPKQGRPRSNSSIPKSPSDEAVDLYLKKFILDQKIASILTEKLKLAGSDLYYLFLWKKIEALGEKNREIPTWVLNKMFTKEDVEQLLKVIAKVDVCLYHIQRALFHATRIRQVGDYLDKILTNPMSPSQRLKNS